MTPNSMDSLDLTRKLVLALTGLNLLLGLGIVLMLVLSVVAPEFLFMAIGVKSAPGSPMTAMTMRMIMVLGILSVPLAHLVLTRLRAIIETVQPGPFILANADRLRTMGWALLGLEVLHLGVGISAKALALRGQPAGIDWGFSATRWLAVLLLFVLARVFEQGTRMREDLEGTI
jgi:hypothetical protein